MDNDTFLPKASRNLDHFIIFSIILVNYTVDVETVIVVSVDSTLGTRTKASRYGTVE